MMERTLSCKLTGQALKKNDSIHWRNLHCFSPVFFNVPFNKLSWGEVSGLYFYDYYILHPVKRGTAWLGTGSASGREGCRARRKMAEHVFDSERTWKLLWSRIKMSSQQMWTRELLEIGFQCNKSSYYNMYKLQCLQGLQLSKKWWFILCVWVNICTWLWNMYLSVLNTYRQRFWNTLHYGLFRALFFKEKDKMQILHDQCWLLPIIFGSSYKSTENASKMNSRKYCIYPNMRYLGSINSTVMSFAMAS